jgi:predicted RNA-binding protein with PUA-like domain
MKYFLLKSEPESYSIDDFAKDKITLWTGIRNYRARNVIRDEMSPGDLFLYYHSMGNPNGVVGIGKILDNRLPDTTAKDKPNPWYAPKIKFIEKFKRIVTLEEIKKDKRFKDMVLIKLPRLSVQPVSKEHFELIVKKSKISL